MTVGASDPPRGRQARPAQRQQPPSTNITIAPAPATAANPTTTITSPTTAAISIIKTSTSPAPPSTTSLSPIRHNFSRRLLSQLRHHTRILNISPHSTSPAAIPDQTSATSDLHDRSPASSSSVSTSPQRLAQQPDDTSSSSSILSDISSAHSLSSSLNPPFSWPLPDPASCPLSNFRVNAIPNLGRSATPFHRPEVKAPPTLRMTRNSDQSMAATGELQQPSIRFIPFHDPRASRPSLTFQALSRTLPSAESVIKVGRYSERDAQPGDMPRGMPSSAPVGFKSKVVSRRHCEFWCEGLQWWVKDVKSSSGTFLNHLRLSPPGVESKPWKVNDGDVIQLGIDFRGGEEMIFRCVKIRIELNRGWQKALNNFNKSTHRRIRKLQEPSPRRDSDNASMSSSECAICLMGVLPCQSLFVAPCSHVWHYKCIRPILTGPGYPQFLCPNCRAVTDLEADIEEAESDWEEDLKEAIAASRTENAEHDSTSGADAGETLSNGIDANGDTTMADMSAPPARPAPGPPAPIDTTIMTAETNAPVSHSNNPGLTIQQPQNASSTSAIDIPSRTVSPGSRRYEVTTNGPTEGPQTPRNDAGPFVLDGGAGAASQGSGAAFVGSRLNPANTASGTAI